MAVFYFTTSVLVTVSLMVFWRLFSNSSIDYNEGWNLLFTERAWLKDLYPNSIFLMNNYPPFSFYLIKSFSFNSFFSVLLVGRLISLAGFIGVIHVVVRLTSLNATLGKFHLKWISILLPLFFIVYYPDYVGTMIPQWIGMFFSFWALYILHKSDYNKLFLPAILIVLSGFIKPNLIELPIGIIISLGFFSKRSAALKFSALLILGPSLLLFTFYLIYGEVFLSSLFNTPRTFHPGKLPRSLSWIWMIIPLASWNIYSLFHMKDIAARRLTIISTTALSIAIVMSLGSGVYYNIYFSAIILVLISTFTHFHHYSDKMKKIHLCWFSIVMVYGVSHFAYQVFSTPHQAPINLEHHLSHQRINLIKNIQGGLDGFIVCEDLLMCIQGGVDPDMDIYMATQQLNVHKLKDSDFVQEIHDKTFILSDTTTYHLNSRILEDLNKNRESLDTLGLRIYWPQ